MNVSMSPANPRRSFPEKREEFAAQRLMATLGFTSWRLSQARATRQTPGWPDLFFTHPAKRLAVFYEAKAPKGKQSTAQREFQSHVIAAGMEYVVGTHDVLVAWAEAKGLCRALASGGLERTR